MSAVNNCSSLIELKNKTTNDSDSHNSPKRIFDIFSKTWSYAGKSLYVTRQTLNAISRSCRWICLACSKNASAEIKKTVLKLKFFTIVGVPLNALDIPQKIQKIWQNIKWNDKEGVLLASLSFAIITTDIFDSLTTFVNAVLETMSQSIIQAFSVLGTPLAAAMISMSTVNRGIHIYNLSKFLHELDSKIMTKITRDDLDPNEFNSLMTSYLNSKLGMDSELVEAQHKQAILERHTNTQTIKLLKTLVKVIETSKTLSSAQLETTIVLKDIKATLHKEIAMQSGYLLVNAINTTALVLFNMPCFFALPYVFLAAGMIMRLGLQASQDWLASKQKLSA